MLLSTLLSLHVTAISASCFIPNGTVRAPDPGHAYQPCNSGSEYSMCCATNRTYDADQCLQNGLCYNPIGDYYWRESCTDPTWMSEACSPLCRGSSVYPYNLSQGDWSGTDAPLTLCIDGSICCGYENTTGCCNLNLGVHIDASGHLILTSTTSTSTFTSPSVSISTQPSTTQTPNPSAWQPSSVTSPTAPSNSGNNAIIIGISVPLSIIILALGILGLFFYRRSRRTANNRTHSPPADPEIYPPKPELPAPTMPAPHGAAIASGWPKDMNRTARNETVELAGNWRDTIPRHGESWTSTGQIVELPAYGATSGGPLLDMPSR